MISIIIPCYNVSEYIGQALESILTQQFILNTDYEIICVDDCSTDSTMEILQLYSNKGVKIVTVDKNRGVSHARNIGLIHAKGEYVWFFDADDLASPNSLQQISNVIKNNHVEAIRFYASFVGEESANDKIVYLEDLPTNNNLYCFVFKRNFINDKKLFFCEEMTYSEDVAFICMCFVNKITIYDISEALYYYRQRSTSLIHRKDENKYFQSILKLPFYYVSFMNISIESTVKHNLTMLIYDAVQSCVMHAVRKDRKTLRETLQLLCSAGLYPYPIRWNLLNKSQKFRVIINKSIFLFAPIQSYLYFLNHLIGKK